MRRADASHRVPRHDPGIRLIINPRNLGYLRSCNAAARVANGKFLLFLNNDTQVLPDWLDPLLAPFARGSTSAPSAPNCCIRTAGCRRLAASSGTMVPAGTTAASMIRIGPSTIIGAK